MPIINLNTSNMKTSKLALFNSVRGNYSQKTFQPAFELAEATVTERKMSADERNERLAQFKARKAMGKVKNFADAEYTALKSADANFTMTLPNEVLSKFPETSKTLTKAQIRARHRSEVKSAKKGS